MHRVWIPIVLLVSVTCVRSAVADDFADRLFVKIGGMRPGSGVGGGVEFRDEHIANGWGDLRVESKVSIRLYQEHEVELIKPHVLDSRLFFEVLGAYRRYTQIDYFGIGPGASEANHSNFLLDGAAIFATVGFRPAPHFQLGGRAGYLHVSIESGTDGNLPSIEDVFDPDTVPGLNEQPDYYVAGLFVALDRRNHRDDPTAGAYYAVQASRYHDRRYGGRFDFRDLDVDVRHYFPVRSRVSAAVRLRSVLTGTADGSVVPFYLLPSLGGAESLHSFENDRFRDRHMIYFSAELRYQVNYAIRLETFVDSGQVSPTLGALAFRDFEWSYGVGARYKVGTSVLVGANLGFGREGPRITFKSDFRF